MAQQTYIYRLLAVAQAEIRRVADPNGTVGAFQPKIGVSVTIDNANKAALDAAMNHMGWVEDPTASPGDLLFDGHFCEMDEMTEPAAPASGSLRYFARSNGQGSPNHRTQFCVKWSDGSVTVVAESPAS